MTADDTLSIMRLAEAQRALVEELLGFCGPVADDAHALAAWRTILANHARYVTHPMLCAGVWETLAAVDATLAAFEFRDDGIVVAL